MFPTEIIKRTIIFYVLGPEKKFGRIHFINNKKQ